MTEIEKEKLIVIKDILENLKEIVLTDQKEKGT